MDLDVTASELVGLFQKNRATFILSLLLAIPFVFILLAVFQTWQATFSVRAESGIIEIVTKERQPSWMLNNIEAIIDSGEIQNKTGVLTISSNVYIKFQVLSDGRVYVIVNHAEQSKTNIKVATFENIEDGSVTVVNKILEFQFPVSIENQGYVLPVQGMIKIGDVLHDQTSEDNPILNSGHIQVFGGAIFGEGRYKVFDEDLDSGDQIRLIKERNEPTLGYGFITIKSQPIMQVQYHAEADFAEISRFGSDGYTIGPTVWDRISNDPILKIIVDFLTIWIPIVLAFMLISARLLDSRKKKTVTEDNTEDDI